MPSLSPILPLVLLPPPPLASAPASLSSPPPSLSPAVALSPGGELETLTRGWQRSWSSVAGLVVLQEHGSSLGPGKGSC